MSRHRYVGHKRRIISDEEASAILAQPPERSHADIAREYGVHRSTISRIRGPRQKEEATR